MEGEWSDNACITSSRDVWYGGWRGMLIWLVPYTFKRYLASNIVASVPQINGIWPPSQFAAVLHSMDNRLYLLRSFVDLIEETLKNTLFQPFTLINRIDSLFDLTHFLIFILAVNAFQIHLMINLLDFGFC